MTDPTLEHHSLVYVPIRQIEVDPDQPRREMESPDELNEARTLAGLAASIRQYGILQPIRVRQIGQERYRIISGERRFKAACLAALEEIPVIVVETQQDILLVQLTENVQRKAMTPLELADAIQQLIQSGLSRQRITQQLGLSQSQISILSKLQTVSAPVREALEERLILSPRAAYELNHLPRAQQRILIAKARETQQPIGQLDVIAARQGISDVNVVPLYAPPIMAQTEIDALMHVLDQPVEGETYHPRADRVAIFESLPELAGRESMTTAVGSPAPEQGLLGSALQDEKSDTSIEIQPYLPPIRVPAFTLQRDEWQVLAQFLAEEPPHGLADPGGWLVDALKRKARHQDASRTKESD